MTSETSSTAGVLPLHNPQPAPLPRALVSWYEASQAYRDAWIAFEAADDHHTAFLAMHALQHAMDVYKDNLSMRPPKEGDLANLRHLEDHVVQAYARHDRFLDEAHIDYPALRRSVLAQLRSLREDATRRCAVHAVGLACVEFPSLSYSSSIDDMETLEKAVALMETYQSIQPLFAQDIDIRPLVSTLRAIAAEEAKGFSDYKDERFATMFEDLTVRIGKLHLERSRRPRPA